MSYFPAGSLEWYLALSWSLHFWVYPHFLIILGYLPLTLDTVLLWNSYTKSVVDNSIIYYSENLIWQFHRFYFGSENNLVLWYSCFIWYLVHANPRNRSMCWFRSKVSHGTVMLFYILQNNNNKYYI